MHVVVTVARCRGFAIEGDFHGFAHVGEEVDIYMLAIGGNVVVNIYRTRVVPLTQDVPTVFIINQDNKSVIIAGSRMRLIVAIIVRQCEVEVQSKAAADLDLRSDQPTFFRTTININPRMIVEHIVFGTKIPI